MNVEKVDWNVVVAGFWNPAILTPAGIARRLFGLPEGTPVLVEVSTNGVAPYRVKHDNLTVTAEMGRLVVNADAPTYELLDCARKAAAKAIKGLPDTPLTAAGYNVRVQINDPQDALLSAAGCPLDNLISDAGFTIGTRILHRSLEMEIGSLNLSIQQDANVRVELNFHLQSADPKKLTDWLEYPINEVEKKVSSVMEKVFQVSMEESVQ